MGLAQHLPVDRSECQDANRSAELDALGVVYRAVLDCHAEKKKGGPPTAPDDAKEIRDVRAKDSIQQR
jgi:hypothetical protein